MVEPRENSIVAGNAANPPVADSGGGIFSGSSPATVLFFGRIRVTANAPNNCTRVIYPS